MKAASGDVRLLIITKTRQCALQFFQVVKKKKKKKKISRFGVIFFFFALNIDCGYPLEPSRRGDCTQCMFWIKNKKIGIPLYEPQFF